jgi:hypothetical protein
MSDLALPCVTGLQSRPVAQVKQAASGPKAEMRRPQNLGDHFGCSSLNFVKESGGHPDRTSAFTTRPPPDFPPYRLK